MNDAPHKSPLKSALESKQPSRRPISEYKHFVRNHYDGPAGALTAVTGVLTGHDALGGRLIRPDRFDVRGCKHILDAGCGNGRYSVYLLKTADPDATLTAFDLSTGMLARARKRLHSDRVTFAAADLTKLPYRSAAFDAVVCGWVLEHLPDPRPGLSRIGTSAATRWQAAADVYRRHLPRRLVQPFVALPHLQPSGIAEGLRRMRPDLGPRIVVFAPAPQISSRRRHRGIEQDVSGEWCRFSPFTRRH